ncbi:MAG: hypothetical protein K8R68_04020 [Bacteroidales bacterium]|nr:hypothetical protein [Bacteroidales bacterium]
MKTQHKIYVLIIVLLVLSSCREITYTTKVHKDGSFTRTVTITGDSSHVFKKDLPYPVDGTWLMEVNTDTTSAGDYILTYTKTFKNSDQLQEEIQQDTSWRKGLDRSIEVRKRFGVFYSYLTYKEVYKACNPFSKRDYRDYVSEEDMQWISGNKIALTKNDSTKSSEAEEKALAFIIESISLEITAEIKKGINVLNNPELTEIMVDEFKDSVEVKLDKWDFESISDFIDYYVEWTGVADLAKLHNLKPPLFDTLEHKANHLFQAIEMEDYQQFVEMPGLITETNSLSVTGNSVNWRVTLMPMLLKDFEMIVESRVVNIFGFVISGIVLLLFFVALIFKTRN